MKAYITESDIREMVSMAVKNLLNEMNSLMKFPQGYVNSKGEGWKREFLKNKAPQKYPDLHPDGFMFVGDELRHDGRKKPKGVSVAREKIGKPEGMSDEEYLETIVKPNNDKFTHEVSAYPDEEFRPIRNSGRYFGGEANYEKSYEISNYGRLRILDYSDVNKCRIVTGYEAPTRNAIQFHLNFTSDGDDSKKTCPPVANMVADAFLEPMDPKKYIVRFKDGDWHNVKADNLYWAPRRNEKRGEI